MDAVMFSTYSHHLTLKSFHLSCMFELWENESDYFNRWVEAAKHRHIEVLRLHFSYFLYVPLAPTIFCCKTLVNLTLTLIRVATMFHCSINLPLLKTRYLSSVQFEDMKDFMNLLSGCPILEFLHTIGVRYYRGRLERIFNEEINSYYKGFPVFENLTNLHLKLFQARHVWYEVVKMLQSCPKLQTLRIVKCHLNSTTIEG
ncbi:putative leucine-rich repeat domain, L domain-containing protein [Medicago truncatula]|uniref:Putative leucine-rich repeat domain, L domain-containing protein n=1 Tax=Medicago truncatula TaxID=3880 RepID=A0A396HNI5_MEDTR|nr:putative leucine-rich repeat domain, L domain-containing protein [Medicago truncatula]